MDDRKEMLSAGSHHTDPLTDGVHRPRALHHLQPHKTCTQTCSRTPKYIRKTCSGAKAHSVLGTDLVISGPAAQQLLGQRVGSFKRCHAPGLRAITRCGGAGGERVGVPAPLQHEGRTRLNSRASRAVVLGRDVSVAEGHVEDLRSATLDRKENIV